MDLTLIVIRTKDVQLLAEFYSLLGIAFDYHKHGNSPYHYSATVGRTVIEIYPLAKEQQEPDKELRLGFTINDFEAVVQRLKEMEKVFVTEPRQTDYGFMTIIKDPDGRRIELYKA